jgi:hypothetical protein
VSDLSFLASLSSNNEPDVGFYSVDVPAGHVLTAEISRSFFFRSVLDPVLDFMAPDGSRLNGCRVGDAITPFNQPCLSDDFLRNGFFTLDSKLAYVAATAQTVYFRVSDAFGDFRPDFRYGTRLSVLPTQAFLTSSSPIEFPRQLLGNSSAVFPVTINNSGSATTTLAASAPIAIVGEDVGDFSLASGSTCVASLTLPPGGSCVVNLIFHPTEAGFRFATLSISHSGFASPQRLDLRGDGVDLEIGLDIWQASEIAVSAGGLAVYKLLLNSGGAAPPIPVSLAVSGLPLGAKATLSPPTQRAGFFIPVVTLTVTTTARSATPVSESLRPSDLEVMLYKGVGIPLFISLVLLNFMRHGAARRRWALVAVTMLCVTLLGCKGGGSGGPASGGSSARGPGTPAGTYVLTVTGTAGSLSRSIDLILTVR